MNIEEFIESELKKPAGEISKDFSDSVLSQISAIKKRDADMDALFAMKQFPLPGFCDRVMEAISNLSSFKIFYTRAVKFCEALAAAAGLAATMFVYYDIGKANSEAVLTESDYAQISEITDEINSTYVLLAQESVLDILNM